MHNKAANQYIQRYAETEVKLLTGIPKHHYRHVLVVPAYKESCRFLENFMAAQWFQQDVLLILPINQPDTDLDLSQQQTLHQYALKHSKKLWKNQHLELLEPITATSQTCGHILLIDRYNSPLPHKQAVGLARKIGSDIALALIHQGIIRTKWIATSDADATLPGDYFSALSTVEKNAVAVCYAFNHTGDDPVINAATLIYQRSLHYYVAGLNYAGSPYAFHSIGSTLAFKAQAYAEVRGFPKRAAGEDFYLLNKLAKIGPVKAIKNTSVQLEARLSDRVPFGTGVSTAKIIQLNQDDEPFHYYHPAVFTDLRETLIHFNGLWEQRNNVPDWLDKLPHPQTEILRNLGLTKFLEKTNHQHYSETQFTAQLTGWFDALKTLRFIHKLRDQCYPNIPLDEAITLANFPVDK